LEDDVLAWELHADGTWVKVPTRNGINAQRVFQKLAVARSHASQPDQDA
jgi:hypothetical protein